MEKIINTELTRKIDTLFACALRDRVFSGAAVGLSVVRKNVYIHDVVSVYGHTEGVLNEHLISTSTFFDLASLTKPLVTVLSILALIKDGKVRLTDSLQAILSTNVPSDKEDITIAQLMSHCSGLPAHRNYFVRALAVSHDERKKELMKWILGESLQYAQGEKHVYSDLGYMLLGAIVENISGMEMEEYWREKVAMPLGLQNKLKFPRKDEFDSSCCAVTQSCPWTHRRLCGDVHDDNCRALGGQAGHAGLFGTIEGVLELCKHLCEQWQGGVKEGPFSSSLLRSVMHRVDSSTWTLGFDTPSKLYSSSGKYFDPQSVGHLGFTGTSFWIDLKRGICIVLLTNRVHMSREKERKIKIFRPKLHDIIMKELV